MSIDARFAAVPLLPEADLADPLDAAPLARALTAGGLSLAGIAPASTIAVGLAIYALLAHLTSIQRMRRAVALLRAADRSGPV